MDLDLFLKKYSHKFSKGHLDLSSKHDINLLISFLEEISVSLPDEDVVVEEIKDNTEFGIILHQIYNGNVPAVKNKYNFTKNLTILPEDLETFKELYEIIPAQNIGNGELAIYWLFNYNDPNNPTSNAKKQKGLESADLEINDVKIEIKSYKTLNSKITLGKYKKDIATRNLINNIFGISNLYLSSDKNAASEVRFNAENLESSIKQLIILKNILISKQELFKESDIFNLLLNKINEIIPSEDEKEITKNILISLVINKLTKKPGLGQYILNITPETLNIECIYIPLNSEEILRNKPYEELVKSINVSSSEIHFNCTILT